MAKAAASGPGPAAQIDRSELTPENMRVALRPDDQWYLVIPMQDPKNADGMDQLQCLLTPDLAATIAVVRAMPDPDDFDEWANAREPRGGA
ncbi:hypothetical protein [Microbacterium sp. MM2322]|uniref:hypothetical protein n=1 Tax=Microbacterium sp. MM2322 TaxID=3157631 RepID=UPI0032D5866F